MRISSKSRFAITTMLELVTQDSRKALKLADIAETHGISLSYLEQIFAALRAKGLVEGRRGPGGGYALSREPSDISISDIICAVDEWVEYSINKPRSSAATLQPLSSRSLWDDLSHQLFNFLSDISLQDVYEGGLAKIAQPRAAQQAAAINKAA
jgi:Rrf2 family iron-sulfur cluster assembly transcriptional regulator